MLRIATETALSPEEAVNRAVGFFGPGGYGMEVKSHEGASAYLEGAGGSVEVTASTSPKGSSIELVTREWEFQTREFIEMISQVKKKSKAK